ncbi:hypothetical protein EV649_5123 [Kribbella sp. VKM Ac-2569]|uniref:hypothetical protein n=1 Tax=Kribbella sp. VKM Ac-2569 TaxID=2512220 RepID=UPI0010DC6C8C|nr:hypothetical protein [Kribbella sp. VKM Ac-2569]RZT17575.1 hypothetical protein EV649_5123 [Kribbella sp. VKM Ac-2569]
MGRRQLARGLVLLLAASGCTAGCSVAQRADGTAPAPVPPSVIIPTAIAPTQPEGLDGTSGAPGPQVCTAITRQLTAKFRGPVTAKPNAWNDGGLPAMDLCTLLLGDLPVTIGVSALPIQPDTLSRLVENPGAVESLPELGPEATISESRIVFRVADRAVRISPAGGIDRDPADGIEKARAIAIALAARDAVPRSLRPARQADETCQLATSAAERFIRLQVQLRRDYRVKGALTCIWGTYDATVSIVEAFDQLTIPEAQQVPPPRFAPIGQPGYYLPEAGELVFRQGRRVVRVTALTNPPREVTLATLTNLVDPMLPLFLR